MRRITARGGWDVYLVRVLIPGGHCYVTDLPATPSPWRAAESARTLAWCLGHLPPAWRPGGGDESEAEAARSVAEDLGADPGGCVVQVCRSRDGGLNDLEPVGPSFPARDPAFARVPAGR